MSREQERIKTREETGREKAQGEKPGRYGLVELERQFSG